MPEIEDREIVYNSWKSYAKALAVEIRKLQQQLPHEKVKFAYESVKREVRNGNLRGRVWTDP